MILSLYKRFSKNFMNFFSTDELVTLLELQGQELTRLQHDLKIKEEAELPQIKEMIKKCESHWKQLHSQIVRKIGIMQTGSDHSNPEMDKLTATRLRLLCTIRLQIQVLYCPIQMSKDVSEAAEERTKKFNESLCKGLVANMVSYFRIISENSMMVESLPIEAASSLKEVDPSILQEFRERNLDLYWLEMISLSIDQVTKSKLKKQASATRALNIRLIMSMNNLKKSFKEYSEFALSFGAYYERYFVENEAKDSTVELIRNFGRLVYLFSKGFTVPGRQKVEDLRQTFMILLKAFRIQQIVPKILELLQEMKQGTLLFGNVIGLREEMLVLIYNLYKMLTFMLLSLDFDQSFFNALFKTWMYLTWQTFDSLGFMRANRLLHLLLHKPSAAAPNQFQAHAVYFDYEVKVLLCSNALNIVRGSRVANDPWVKMAEKELLQLYRCLYCKLLLT